MRVKSSGWFRSLEAMGFRRKKRKTTPINARRLQLEELEGRLLLTVDTNLYSGTSITAPTNVTLDASDEVHFRIAENAAQQIFTVETVNDQQHGLEAVLHMAPNAPADLQTSYDFTVVLDVNGEDVASYQVQVVLPGAQMISDVQADHAQQATSIVAAADAQPLPAVTLNSSGDFVGIQSTNSMGPVLDESLVDNDSALSLGPISLSVGVTDVNTKLAFLAPIVADVSDSITTDGNASVQDRLNLYAGIDQVATAVASAGSTTTDSAVKQDYAHRMGAVLYKLADQLQADRASDDTTLASAAQQAYDAALAQSDLYFRMWSGKGINSEVYEQNTSGDQIQYSLFYESGRAQMLNQFAIELDRPALVGVSVPQIYSSMFAMLADHSGSAVAATYVDLPSGSTVHGGGQTIVVSGASGAQQDGFLKFDLAGLGVTTQQVDHATLALNATAISSTPHVTARAVPNTTWNESTLTGAMVTGDTTLSASASPASTWTAATGANTVDVTEAVRQAMRVGDADFNGTLDGNSQQSDVYAFEDLVLNPTAYHAAYDSSATIPNDILYRGDADFDGQITRSDMAPFLALHGDAPGDMNLDGIVNLLDDTLIASYWQTASPRYEQGDGNFDGIVGLTDLTLVASHWLQFGTVAATPAVTLRLSAESGSATFASEHDATASNRPTLTVAQTPDLVITGFSGDGTNLKVTYAVTHSAVSQFNIGIYRSADGTASGQTLMQSFTVANSADRTPGVHTLSITPSADFDTADGQQIDYYLRAVVDDGSAIAEPDETNNALVFQGGAFTTPTHTVEVHGSRLGGSDTADNITVRWAGDANFDGVVDGQDSTAVTNHTGPWGGDLNNDGVVNSSDTGLVTANLGSPQTVQILANGVLISYALSGITGLSVRLHGGDDNLVTTQTFSKSILAFGGADNDSLQGGAAVDTLFGGAGDDSLFGRAGIDYLEGDGGDDILAGGTGDDWYLHGAGGDLGTDKLIELPGQGHDSLSFQGIAAAVGGVYIDLSSTASSNLIADGTGTLLYFDMSDAPEIEYVYGTTGSDTFVTNGLDNYFSGSYGNDTYIFSGTADRGHVSIYDPYGSNTLNFSGLDLGLRVHVDLGTDNAQQVIHAADGRQLTLYNLASNIQNVVGTKYDDILIGNSGGGNLDGQIGDDVISIPASANGSVFVVNGGSGSNTLSVTSSTDQTGLTATATQVALNNGSTIDYSHIQAVNIATADGTSTNLSLSDLVSTVAFNVIGGSGSGINNTLQVTSGADLPPLNESTFGARIQMLGRNRRRSDDATRNEVFCGADYRQAA